MTKPNPKIIAHLLEAPGILWPHLGMLNATKVADEHKKKYGYDQAMEYSMAKLGNATPAHEEELPFDYLTRLLGMAIKLQEPYDYPEWKYGTQSNPIPSDLVFQSGATWKYVTQTNSIPSGPVFQPAWPPSLPDPVPSVVKPKRELPNPIEPKKRLMKRNT